MVRRPTPDDGQNRKRPLTADELAKALGRGPGTVRYTPKVEN